MAAQLFFFCIRRSVNGALSLKSRVSLTNQTLFHCMTGWLGRLRRLSWVRGVCTDTHWLLFVSFSMRANACCHGGHSSTLLSTIPCVQMGVGNGDHVVVYDGHSEGLMASARVWWMFRVSSLSPFLLS